MADFPFQVMPGQKKKKKKAVDRKKKNTVKILTA